jgi:hypothetical protein
MQSIVPERPPKETARSTEALRAEEGVACAKFNVQRLPFARLCVLHNI